MRKKLTAMFVSPEFKKKMFKEAKINRGITVAEYSRLLAASDKDIKSLINEDIKVKEKKVKRGFDFGF